MALFFTELIFKLDESRYIFSEFCHQFSMNKRVGVEIVKTMLYEKVTGGLFHCIARILYDGSEIYTWYGSGYLVISIESCYLFGDIRLIGDILSPKRNTEHIIIKRYTKSL